MGKALKSFAQWRVQENLREYNFYFKKYQRLLMSMFQWDNLPDGISSRFIENKLFYNGLLIFYKSKQLGFYVVAQATPLGLNDYEEPTGYRAYGVNKINEYVKPSECVPIWNDMFIEGNVANVNFFAKSLSNVKKTFDVNLEQLKNPYIISCPEGQKETVKQIMEQKTDGVPYIFTSDDFNDLVKVNVFNLQIQNHTKELQDVKGALENEGLTFFGINNVNVLKRERLTTSEADQNDEQIILNKNSMYKARKKAVEEINEKFNLNIELTISSNFESELQSFGGDNIGNE
jgi:vacuolar-type H+-ATPase subunit F/Vma7